MDSFVDLMKVGAKVLADGNDDIALAFAVGAALGGIHLALQDGVDLGLCNLC